MIDQIWNQYMKIVHISGIGDINAWAKLDLTMQQLKVLMVLDFNEEMTVSSLAEIVNVSLPNMTGIIDRLVQNELVERIPSLHDRRVILLRNREKSKEIFESLFSSSFSRFEHVIGQLEESDLEKISVGLRILVQAFQYQSVKST